MRKLMCVIAVVVGVFVPSAGAVNVNVLDHAQDVIRFFEHHPKAAATPHGHAALFRAVRVVNSTVRSLQDVRDERKQAEVFPPHHKLWTCIAYYESTNNWQATNGSHFGGLQMTYDWMGVIDNDARNYSQAEQEWAAERAWAANGYSYSFLEGQWYRWDNADGCGTTG